MLKPWVLIPAYKPDSRLPGLIEQLKDNFQILVVDDGGGEAYSSVFDSARTLGAVVLTHDVNRGKGAAIKTGLAWLQDKPGVSGVITADADGQHSPEDIEKIAAAMAEHPDAVIIGGRDFSHMPARSRFGNTITRFFFRLGTGSRISDTQSGLRGLPASLFDKLAATEGDRYEYEMNVLLSLGDWHAPAVEIPISTIYIDDNSSSHFHALKDGLKVFSRVMRYFLSSIISTALDYALYALLLTWLPPTWSYAGARSVSCIVNYLLNVKMVFKSSPTAKNAAGYFSLAVVVMALGSAGVTGLTAMGLGSVLSKIIVDCTLYVCNYIIQKKYIFKK